MNKEFETIKEYAESHHYSERRVREMCHSGKIKAERVGEGRKWLIPIDDVATLSPKGGTRHDDDLADLCQRIVLLCERYECDLKSIKTIGELPEFEIEVAFRGKDRILQSYLLDHLKAEFPELIGLKSLDELPKKYINKLRQLAARRSFKGTCDICKS